MSYVEVLTGHGLTQEQWDDQIFKEYLGMTWWSNVMGTSIDSIIQVKDDLTKKPGDAITIGLAGQMVGGHVTGNAKAKDNEGSMSFYYQRITIDNDRVVIKIENIPMTQKRVGFDVLSQAKQALQDKAKYTLEDDITTALASVTYGHVQGRYLYGSLESNYSATHATGLATVDNTADQLTTTMIDKAKRKCTIPVNAIAKVRPTRIKVGQNYEEWFDFVGHTYCIRDLVNNDAAFRNAQLLLPPQANRDSVLFNGSSFKGSWNGTLIHEYDRMPLVSSTIQVGHNFMLGAQAGAVVWGQRSKFGEEDSDVGHDKTYELHEIRGISKLYFDRTTVEDQGIVHVFAAAVADQ